MPDEKSLELQTVEHALKEAEYTLEEAQEALAGIARAATKALGDSINVETTKELEMKLSRAEGALSDIVKLGRNPLPYGADTPAKDLFRMVDKMYHIAQEALREEDGKVDSQ